MMNTCKTNLGDEHDDTLMSIANLGYAWISSGKTTEANNLLRVYLARQNQAVGPSHSETNISAEVAN
jgi:hypothetical protein